MFFPHVNTPMFLHVINYTWAHQIYFMNAPIYPIYIKKWFHNTFIIMYRFYLCDASYKPSLIYLHCTRYRFEPNITIHR